MNEQAQIKMEQCQNKLKELFTPQFQHDLLEVCIETFGGDSKEQFEQNFKRIAIYPKFNLNKVHTRATQNYDEKQYFESTSYSFMKSVYDKFDIDPENYGNTTLEENLKKNLLENSSSSYTTCCIDKSTNEICYPIFIAMDGEKSDENLRGIIAHEVLHALEFVTQRDERGLRAKTGHYTWGETGENVLTAECLHVAILFTKIYPMLKEKGYEITDSCDYLFSMGEGFFKFFGTYFKQICATAYKPDLNELTDVIGTENWKQFVALQNSKRGIMGHQKEEEAQIALVDKMQEYSKNSLAQRIGKATLNKQLDIEGKRKAKEQLEELMHDKRRESQFSARRRRKMNTDLETRNAYTEVITVINALPDIDKAKIPNNLLNTIRENSNLNYNFQIDILVSVNSWNLSEKAKIILAVIFRDYLATERQFQKIKNEEQNQIKKLEETARNKYNSDNIFKTNNKFKEEKVKQEELALVEIKKENKLVAWFRKILNLIKRK